MNNLDKAIQYFEDAIKESNEIIDEIIADRSPRLRAELGEQKGHFEVALQLMRLWRESRLIVLPVPIGTPVYVTYPQCTDIDGSIIPAGVKETRLSGYINETGREFYLTYDNLNSCDIKPGDLYITREAAEAALKEARTHE